MVLPTPRKSRAQGHAWAEATSWSSAPSSSSSSNCLIVNGQEWGSTQYVLVEGMYVFTAQADPTGAIQPGTLGTAKLQRQWAWTLRPGTVGGSRAYDPFAFGNSVYLGQHRHRGGFIRKGEVAAQAYDTAEMAKVFARAFENHIFTTGQLLVFEFKGMNLIATIRGVEVVELHEIQQRSQSAPQVATRALIRAVPIAVFSSPRRRSTSRPRRTAV